MATIGHGLIGLFAAGLAPRRPAGLRRTFLLPGFLVLAAYAVDVVEWCCAVVNPDIVDGRTVGHSALAVAVVIAGMCLLCALLFRVRRFWMYTLVAAVVLSHVAMDWPVVRAHVAQLHLAQLLQDEPVTRCTAVLAETRVYGLPFVLAILVRAAGERGCSRRARRVSLLLAGACLASMALPYSAAWATAYLLSIIHAAILLRRHLSAALCWNLVLLVPVLAVGATTLMMNSRLATAGALARNRNHYEALLVYQSALRLPSRDGRASAYLGMGLCYQRLTDWTEAERCFLKGRTFQERRAWAEVLLARLYSSSEDRALRRPDEALRLYRHVLAGDDASDHLKEVARRELDTLRERTSRNKTR